MKRINKKHCGIFITTCALTFSSVSYVLSKTNEYAKKNISLVNIEKIEPNYDFEDEYNYDGFERELKVLDFLNFIDTNEVFSTLNNKISNILNKIYNYYNVEIQDDYYNAKDFVNKEKKHYEEIDSKLAHLTFVNNVNKLEFSINDDKSDKFYYKIDNSDDNFTIELYIPKETNDINQNISSMFGEIANQLFIEESKDFTEKYNSNLTSFLSYYIYGDSNFYNKKFYDFLQLVLLFDDKYDENTIKDIVINQNIDLLMSLFDLSNEEKKNLIVSLNILYGNNSVRDKINNRYITNVEEAEIASDTLISLTKVFYKNLITYNEKNNLALEDFYYSKQLFDTMVLDLANINDTYSEEFILKYKQIDFNVSNYIKNRYNLSDNNFVVLKNDIKLKDLEKCNLNSNQFTPLILLGNLDIYKRNFYKNIFTTEYVTNNSISYWNANSQNEFNDYTKKLNKIKEFNNENKI